MNKIILYTFAFVLLLVPISSAINIIDGTFNVIQTDILNVTISDGIGTLPVFYNRMFSDSYSYYCDESDDAPGSGACTSSVMETFQIVSTGGSGYNYNPSFGSYIDQTSYYVINQHESAAYGYHVNYTMEEFSPLVKYMISENASDTYSIGNGINFKNSGSDAFDWCRYYYQGSDAACPANTPAGTDVNFTAFAKVASTAGECIITKGRSTAITETEIQVGADQTYLILGHDNWDGATGQLTDGNEFYHVSFSNASLSSNASFVDECEKWAFFINSPPTVSCGGSDTIIEELNPFPSCNDTSGDQNITMTLSKSYSGHFNYLSYNLMSTNMSDIWIGLDTENPCNYNVNGTMQYPDCGAIDVVNISATTQGTLVILNISVTDISTHTLYIRNVSYFFKDITLHSPTNTTYGHSDIGINVSSIGFTPEAWWWTSDDGVTNTTFTPNVTVVWPDGVNDLDVYANDSGGVIFDEHVVFTVDTIVPSAFIFSPENGSVTKNNLTTLLQLGSNETVTTWNISVNGGPNVSITPNTTFTAFPGTNVLTVYAIDSIGNMGINTSTFTASYLAYLSQTYPAYAIESSQYNFSATFNASSDIISAVSANITVNSTAYLYNSSSISGSLITLMRYVTMPNISSYNSTLMFYWNATSTYPEVNASGPVTNITIFRPYLTACGGIANTTVIGFRILNEENNFTAVDNSTMEIVVTYWPSSNESATHILNTSFTNGNDYSLCMYPSVASIQVDADIWYHKLSTNFPVRNYFLRNASIVSNVSNITLYLLNTTYATTISFELISGGGTPYTNAIIKAQRYYTALNAFITVAMGMSDIDGQTNMPLRPIDVWHRFIIEKDGEVVQTIDQMLITSSTQQFFIAPESVIPYFDYYQNIATNCTYNNATTVLRCTFSDTSGHMQSIRLHVEEFGTASMIDICDTTVTTSSGTLLCTVGNITGKKVTWSLVATFSSYPTTLALDGGILQGTSAIFFGTMGIFIALALVVIMAMIGIWNPVVTILMGVAGLVMSTALLFTNFTTGATGELMVVGVGSLMALIMAAAIIILRMKA